MSLSIIISSLNDETECNATILSIRKTCEASVEIIVLDDASDIPIVLDDKSVKLVRNKTRIGCGKCRHLGATIAVNSNLLFIDSHMRFQDGWYEKMLPRVASSPKTLWGVSCAFLTERNMDILESFQTGYGADLVLCGSKQVFEGAWRTAVPREEDSEIPCLMGACYFVNRDWYFYLKGFDSIKMWGSSEPFISLKCWLAGGQVKLCRSVRVGHQFRERIATEKMSAVPYELEYKFVFYNKLRSTYTLLPENWHQFVCSKLQKCNWLEDAKILFEKDKAEIETERDYYKSIFTKDLEWFLNKFAWTFKTN